MELSLIIPVYNAENTLRKTLDAITVQNVEEMEVLLVDNASSDKSAEICKEYMEKDSRFKYFYESRKGVSYTRNTGLKNAIGKYICFCDADDIPESNMYQTLIDDIFQRNVDLVMCNYYSQRDKSVSVYPDQLIGEIGREKIEEVLIPAMFGGNHQVSAIWGTVWRCIFKKEIIENNHLRFDEKLSFAEDFCFVLSYLNSIQTVYFERENLYFYAEVPGSAMLSYHKVKKGLFEERLHLIEKLIGILEEKNLYEKNIQCVHLIFQEYILECIGNASIKQKENSLKTAYKQIKKIVKNPLVKEIFKKIEGVSGKRKLVFGLIQLRWALVLLLYYRTRRR